MKLSDNIVPSPASFASGSSRIATRLIESVEEPEEKVEMSSAWQAEIDRRLESIQNGTATLVPHAEVMTALRQKLAQQTIHHANSVNNMPKTA